MGGGFENCNRKERNVFQVKKNVYYWLSYDGTKKVISMKPYEHLESEKTGIEK